VTASGIRALKVTSDEVVGGELSCRTNFTLICFCTGIFAARANVAGNCFGVTIGVLARRARHALLRALGLRELADRARQAFHESFGVAVFALLAVDADGRTCILVVSPQRAVRARRRATAESCGARRAVGAEVTA
jgi:hypothetical protein